MINRIFSITFALFLISICLGSTSRAGTPTLAAGSSNSFVVKADGTLWAWGKNDFGQLGIGDSAPRDKPVQVGVDTNWSMVAAGETHTIALKRDGTLWGWGQNISGSVGNGTSVQQVSPVQVRSQGSLQPLTNIVAIAAVSNHSFAIDNSGYLWAWGGNFYGQLGDGTKIDKSAGAYRLVATSFKAVAAGTMHTLAVKTDGSLWAWGDGTSGQLGYSPAQISPRQVGVETSWSTVAAGNGSSLALKSNGTLWGWGSNYYGQLGLNITLPDSSSHTSPTQEATLSTWSSVRMGPNNSVQAIRSDATLWSWGSNLSSELGLGDTVARKLPTQVTAAATWSTVAIGTSHVLALKHDGSLFSWGDNYQGALGDGSRNPLTNEGIKRKLPHAAIARVAINDFAGIELKTNGTIWSWGDNSHGILGLGNLISSQFSPAQVTNTVPSSSSDDWTELSCAAALSIIEPNHCIGLKRDGSLWSWGYNTYGALGLGNSSPATVRWNPNNITASSPTSSVPWSTIAAAPSRSMGIRTDGTLWGWGDNSSGQMGNGTYDQLELPTRIGPDSNWWRVSTSTDHTLAIKTNGELWVWGYNYSGKLGTSTTSSPASPVKVATPAGSSGIWFAVSAGDTHSLGIMSDGTLWSWGGNAYGQLGNGSKDALTHATPVKVGTATDWIAVSAGAIHSMALKADGSLYMWGDNSVGQFGNGTSDVLLHGTPAQVLVSTKFDSVTTSCNGASVMALTTDGTVKTWGYNSRGQLGDGSTTNNSSSPITPGYAMAPSFSGAFLSSNNFDSTKAGPGSTIYLELTATQKTTTPRITFNNNPATSVNSSDGGLHWTATYTVTAGDIDGAVTFRADSYSDLFNPNLAGTARTATSNASSVTIDKTPPVVSQVRISSNNSSSTLAKPGDTVNLSFNVSEQTDFVDIKIAGTTYQGICINKACYANHTVTVSTTEGVVSFSLQAFDLAANASTLVTTTNDGSSVIFDKTLPTLAAVTITSNHSPAAIAKINSIITLSFTSSETITTPTVTISGHPATVNGSGTTWAASYAMQSADIEGSVPFSIAFGDLAGNPGVTVSASTNSSNVTFQKQVLVTIPAVSYGTLTPGTSQWLTYNSGLSITITPNQGNSLVGISGCNGTLSGSTYVLTSLVDDCAITASFQDPLPPAITIASPSDGATLDSSALQTLTGTVSDPGSGVATVLVQIRDTLTGNYLQQNNTYAASPAQMNATVNGTVWSYATPIGAFADKSTYLLTVFATDAAGNGASSAAIFTKVPSYELTKTSIKTLAASQSRIAVGNSIAVNGVIERYSSYNDGFIGKSICLDIYAPGATDPVTVNATITSNSGSFSFAGVSTFNVAGSYKITARFPATTWLQPSSADIYIQVGPKAGYAIVVQGQVQNDSQGALAYNKTVKRVMDRMKTQGLATDYLSNDPLQPQDVRYFSSLPDRTHEALDKTEIGKAITTWAAQKLTEAPAPLYIVLIDHGSKEPDAKIFLNTQSITPAELSGWLNTLEGAFTAEQLAILPERVIVVGACYSGAFIDSVSKAGRVVISSAAATEESARGFIEGDGLMTGEYFVDQLFARLERGETFKDAFNAASRDTAMFTRSGTSLVPDPASIYHDTARQHALLDDNGDHIGLNRLPDVGTTEGQLAATIRLGIGRQAQIVPSAEILSTSDTMYLTSLQDGLPSGTYLWVEVNDPALLKVGTYPTALLRTPDSSATGAPGSQITYSLIEYQLTTTGTCTRSDGTQTACYRTADNQLSSDGFNNISTDMFLNQGIYEAYYYVIDKTTLGLSPIRRSVIYKSDTTTVTAPTLSSPPNNSEQKTALAFNWSPVTANGKNITYTLLISSKSDFSVIDGRIEELAENMAMIPLGILKDLATYYWKVQAIDQFGNKGTSLIRKFTTNNRNGLPAMVKGYVTDSSGTPITGATISDGSLTATSLPNGAFLMTVDSAVTVLNASASNYSPKQVSVSLTPGGVTEVLFMLTPPVTTHTLTLTVNGTGSGVVNCSKNLATVVCSGIFNPDDSVTLLATPDWMSLPVIWGGDCNGSSPPNCTVTMGTDRSVNATFNANNQARIGATPYASLQTALDTAGNGATVEAMEYDFLEPILFNRSDITVTVDGGLGPGYSAAVGGYSTVSGSFRIQQGTIKIMGPLAVR